MCFWWKVCFLRKICFLCENVFLDNFFFLGENMFFGENVFLKTFLDVGLFRLSKSTQYAALIWIHVVLDGPKTLFLVETFFFRKLFFVIKKNYRSNKRNMPVDWDVCLFRLFKSTQYAAFIWIYVLLDEPKKCFWWKRFFGENFFFVIKKKTFIIQINAMCPLIWMFVFLDCPNQRNMQRWFGSMSYWTVQKHVLCENVFLEKTFFL